MAALIFLGLSNLNNLRTPLEHLSPPIVVRGNLQRLHPDSDCPSHAVFIASITQPLPARTHGGVRAVGFIITLNSSPFSTTLVRRRDSCCYADERALLL